MRAAFSLLRLATFLSLSLSPFLRGERVCVMQDNAKFTAHCLTLDGVINRTIDDRLRSKPRIFVHPCPLLTLFPSSLPSSFIYPSLSPSLCIIYSLIYSSIYLLSYSSIHPPIPSQTEPAQLSSTNRNTIQSTYLVEKPLPINRRYSVPR